MKPKDLQQALEITKIHQLSFMHGLTTFITANNVRIDSQYLHVDLADGRIISTPLSWYQELQNADDSQRLDYRFICTGTGIEWPQLDYQLSIESMLINSPHQQAA